MPAGPQRTLRVRDAGGAEFIWLIFQPYHKPSKATTVHTLQIGSSRGFQVVLDLGEHHVGYAAPVWNFCRQASTFTK